MQDLGVVVFSECFASSSSWNSLRDERRCLPWTPLTGCALDPESHGCAMRLAPISSQAAGQQCIDKRRLKSVGPRPVMDTRPMVIEPGPRLNTGEDCRWVLAHGSKSITIGSNVQYLINF